MVYVQDVWINIKPLETYLRILIIAFDYAAAVFTKELFFSLITLGQILKMALLDFYICYL